VVDLLNLYFKNIFKEKQIVFFQKPFFDGIGGVAIL
jgi:hypothetical protein